MQERDTNTVGSFLHSKNDNFATAMDIADLQSRSLKHWYHSLVSAEKTMEHLITGLPNNTTGTALTCHRLYQREAKLKVSHAVVLGLSILNPPISRSA
jgi:hypothetical protein